VGTRIVLCEDSNRPGNPTKKLHHQKALELRSRRKSTSDPPALHPDVSCRFALSTRIQEELAARKAFRAIEGKVISRRSPNTSIQRSKKHKQMVEWIAKELGVTTLRYQRIEDMVEAIGLPREKLCLYCWINDHSIFLRAQGR